MNNNNNNNNNNNKGGTNRNVRALVGLFAGALLALAVVAPAQAVPYKKLSQAVAHAVSDVVTFADFSASDTTEAFPVGIPNGARVVGTFVNVTTAFNGGSTASIGWSGSTDALMTNTTLAPGSAGSKTGILFPVLTANQQPRITASYSTVPTAGSMTITVLYYPYTK